MDYIKTDTELMDCEVCEKETLHTVISNNLGEQYICSICECYTECLYEEMF